MTSLEPDNHTGSSKDLLYKLFIKSGIQFPVKVIEMESTGIFHLLYTELLGESA